MIESRPLSISTVSPMYGTCKLNDGSKLFVATSTWAGDLLFLGMVRCDRFSDSNLNMSWWAPILMASSGKIYHGQLVKCLNLNSNDLIKILSYAGFSAHIDVDPFIERLFEAGYTSVKIGYHGNSFLSVACEFLSKNGPTIGIWPAAWKISEEFGLDYGPGWENGKSHGKQLIPFKAVGSYGFGNHVRIDSPQ